MSSAVSSPPEDAATASKASGGTAAEEANAAIGLQKNASIPSAMGTESLTAVRITPKSRDMARGYTALQARHLRPRQREYYGAWGVSAGAAPYVAAASISRSRAATCGARRVSGLSAWMRL